MQTAIETCSTNNKGSYSSCDLTALRAIDPTIPSTAVSLPGYLGMPYVIGMQSTTGNGFYIYRDTTNRIVRYCTVAASDRGGCRTGDTW